MFNKILLELQKKDYKTFIIPCNDRFFSEYVNDSNNLLKYFINFSGSNGLAIISKDKKAFFTDGRYMQQAQIEIDSSFEILNFNEMSPEIWLKQNNIEQIVFDPLLHTNNNIAKLYKNIKTIPYENLLIQYLPLATQRKLEIYPHLIKYAGEAFESKIVRVIAKFSTDILFITNAESISWLLNLRSNEIEFCPTLLSHAFIWHSGEIVIFLKNHDDLKIDNVTFYSLDYLPEYIKKIDNKIVQIDPETCCVAYEDLFKNYIKRTDPILELKAIKNNIEIKGAKRAHLLDGLAVIKFLYLLENKRKFDEYTAAEALLAIRSSSKEFQFPSFATISAFASNGAIIHYNPKKESAKKISIDNLYLLDSGGHYLSGTTDITRVIHLGKPTKEHKKFYTLVLKGHLALLKAVFPSGTTGSEIDILARQFLWQEGYNYPHGTGHGVGNFMNVHEGPQRIGKNGNYPLKENMILSNEPGFYRVDDFGIRIENCMIVSKSKKQDFLKFENLSLVPYEIKLIDKKLLNPQEIESINQYHKRIYNIYAKHLKDNNIMQWLFKKCQKI